MHTPQAKCETAYTLAAGDPPTDGIGDADISCPKESCSDLRGHAPPNIEFAYPVDHLNLIQRGSALPQALVIEDIREASAILKEYG